MKKNYKKAVIESDDKIVKTKIKKRSFSFPYEKRVIEAETLAGASELLNKETNE